MNQQPKFPPLRVGQIWQCPNQRFWAKIVSLDDAAKTFRAQWIEIDKPDQRFGIGNPYPENFSSVPTNEGYRFSRASEYNLKTLVYDPYVA